MGRTGIILPHSSIGTRAKGASLHLRGTRSGRQSFHWANLAYLVTQVGKICLGKYCLARTLCQRAWQKHLPGKISDDAAGRSSRKRVQTWVGPEQTHQDRREEDRELPSLATPGKVPSGSPVRV